jgi:hypothetical protein
MNWLERKTKLTRMWLKQVSTKAFSLLQQQALIVHDTHLRQERLENQIATIHVSWRLNKVIFMFSFLNSSKTSQPSPRNRLTLGVHVFPICCLVARALYYIDGDVEGRSFETLCLQRI